MSVVPGSQTGQTYRAAPVIAPRPPLEPVNDVPLTRDLLVEVLSDLSERLYRSFGRQVCLVVHGGGVMVLHPAIQCHGYTQDIDYIHRSFVREYTALGFRDAEQRLRTCIETTACHFKLGADWMNHHADMTLPWAVKWVQPSIMLLLISQNITDTTPRNSCMKPIWPNLRPNLPRFDASPKHQSRNVFQ